MSNKPKEKGYYKCRYPGCTNCYKIPSENKHFYKFPGNTELLNSWLSAMQLLPSFLSNRKRVSCHVCEDHFLEKDFVNISRNRLVFNAVPIPINQTPTAETAPAETLPTKNVPTESLPTETLPTRDNIQQHKKTEKANASKLTSNKFKTGIQINWVNILQNEVQFSIRDFPYKSILQKIGKKKQGPSKTEMQMYKTHRTIHRKLPKARTDLKREKEPHLQPRNFYEHDYFRCANNEELKPYDQLAKQQRTSRQLVEERKAQMVNKVAKIDNKLQSSDTQNTQTAATMIESLAVRIAQLENENTSLVARTRGLEKLVQSERLIHAQEMALLDAKLDRLGGKIDQQQQECQDPLDIEMPLELQENYFNISAKRKPGKESHNDSGASTPDFGLKRRHLPVEEYPETTLFVYDETGSIETDVKIVRWDRDHGYMKLHNRSIRQVTLKGFELLQKTTDKKIKYNFIQSVIIEPQNTILVWSSFLKLTAHESPCDDEEPEL